MPHRRRVPAGHFRPIPLPRRAAYTPPNLVPVVQFPPEPSPYSPAWARGKDLGVGRGRYEHQLDHAAYYPMPPNPYAHLAWPHETLDPVEGYDDVDELLDLVAAELDYEGSASYYYGEDDTERKRPFRKVLSLFQRKEGEKSPIEKVSEIAEIITAQPEKAVELAQSAQQAAIERFQPPPPKSKAKKALMIGGVVVGTVLVGGGLIWVGTKIAR